MTMPMTTPEAAASVSAAAPAGTHSSWRQKSSAARKKGKKPAASVGVLTSKQIRLLQSRELGPEDYEMLLRLDEAVPPRGLMTKAEAAAALHRETSAAGTECSICLLDIDAGEAVSSLPCEHVFHEACISKWLCERRVACPMCNHDPRTAAE